MTARRFELHRDVDETGICQVDGCERPVHGRGLCGTHHQRLLRKGSTDDSPPPREGCEFPGCGHRHHAHGLCDTHYQRRFKRRGYLRHTYRMEVAEWEALFDAQDRRCPVCLTDTPRGDSVWHVHHDHRCCPTHRSCGRCVIAILCAPCNIAIGGLGDDPERLERAAALMRSVVVR